MSEDAEGSDALLSLVGSTVRQLRQAKHLSAAELARRADVSRRMLSAIESGDGNASLVTLDKIARALGVDFSALVRPRADGTVELMSTEDATVVWNGSSQDSRARVFMSSRSIGPAEVWDWQLGPHDRYDAEPDPDGSEELLAVTAGILILESSGNRYFAPAGTVVRLASDRLYSYVNDGDDVVHFHRIVVINGEPGASV